MSDLVACFKCLFPLALNNMLQMHNIINKWKKRMIPITAFSLHSGLYPPFMACCQLYSMERKSPASSWHVLETLLLIMIKKHVLFSGMYCFKWRAIRCVFLSKCKNTYLVTCTNQGQILILSICMLCIINILFTTHNLKWKICQKQKVGKNIQLYLQSIQFKNIHTVVNIHKAN